ncbi:hypothetical protein HYH03_017199 [Edaphochlamys debaryana]|uniref:Aminotransferase class I/classII large domain-containing protein n=1 Tax=Edaphochlamys debaryana TaxID=47281 RepID=A0A835XJI3_9CHLO|nr:hypothetical protein HYH03_017199 [Edaphochlamys debaryana]|eukprot:KAG2483953.1 hypothetical protein HYH03_017199 [Edaphochlamys debaryana]
MASASAGGGAGGGREWDDWLHASLSGLRSAQLLRTLRPTVPLMSSSEALIYSADLDAWAQGRDPAVAHWGHCCTPPPGALTGLLTGGGPSGGAAAVLQQGPGAGPGPSLPSPGPLSRLRLFSLNDYLGLGAHPEVAAAAARAALAAGMGPRASALVAGYTHCHRQLEEALAELKGTEDCLLFPTGFAANLSLLTTVAAAAGAAGSSASPPPGHPPVAVFSDELNHASIIDGARLAARGAGGAAGASGQGQGGGGGAALHVYRHNDLGHLEELLSATPPGVRCLVVTDSLFSMDGDFADLRGLAALKARRPFLLALDEAHATLVAGERGGGAAEAAGVADQVDLHIGTLSKAAGCLGGFAACTRGFKQLLLNRGRAYVYSTALPLPVVEAAGAALRVAAREPWRRRHVWSLVERLGRGLGVPALSPVVPLVLGPEGPTLELAARLLRAGLHVPPIRPPTVPQGTCRLRVSLSAAHSYADVDELVGLVRASGVPLLTLPHLQDPRAALPGGPGSAGGGEGAVPLSAGELMRAGLGRGAGVQSRL